MSEYFIGPVIAVVVTILVIVGIVLFAQQDHQEQARKWERFNSLCEQKGGKVLLTDLDRGECFDKDLNVVEIGGFE